MDRAALPISAVDPGQPASPAASSHAVFQFAPDGRILDVNDTACRWLGYRRDQLLALHIFDINPQISADRWPEHWLRLREHKCWSYESTHRRRDGSTFPIELTTTHLCFGDTELALSVVQDISERRRTQEQLETLANRLSAAQQLARLGYWERDLASNEVIWSDQMFRIFGYEPHEVAPTFERVVSHFHPDDRQRVVRHMQESAARGEDFEIQVRLIRRGGEVRELHSRVKTMCDDTGRPTRLIGVSQDVTELLAVQRALENTADQLREAQRIAHVGSWVWHVPADTVWWSEQMYALYGYDPAQTTPSMDLIFARVPPQEQQQMRQKIQAALERDEPYVVNHRILLPDGRISHCHCRAKLVRDEDGRPLRMYGTTQDVTDRLRVQRQLEAAIEGLNEAQRVGHIGSWDWDIENNVETWSDEMYRIFGYEPGERQASYDFFLSCIHPDDRRRVDREVREALRRSDRFSSEYRIVLPDGRVRECHSRGRILRDEAGQAVRMFGTGQDVTERKRAETALRRSEAHYRHAAETNRRLLAEVNHRVRNNLTGLLSLLRITREETRDVDEFSELMRQRITAMTKAHNLLAGAQWHSLDLLTLIRAIAAGYCPVDHDEGRVSLEGPTTWIAPRQVVPFALALNELFINAAKHGCYCAPGGQLHVNWQHNNGQLVLHWCEKGGPPITGDIQPSLGTELIHGFIGFELNGQVQLTYPHTGVRHTLRIPLEREESETP